MKEKWKTEKRIEKTNSENKKKDEILDPDYHRMEQRKQEKLEKVPFDYESKDKKLFNKNI